MKNDQEPTTVNGWMPSALVVLTPPQFRGEQGRRARFSFAMNGMKQLALARMIDAKQPVIASWIKGAKPGGISLANRKKLAAKLGTTVEWLESGTGLIPQRLQKEMRPAADALLYCRLVGLAYQNARPNGGRSLSWRTRYGVPSPSMSAAEWEKTGLRYDIASPDQFARYYSALVEIYRAPEPILLTREEVVALMLRHNGRDLNCDVAGDSAPVILQQSTAHHIGMDMVYMRRWPDVVSLSYWAPEPLRSLAAELRDIRCKLYLPHMATKHPDERQKLEGREAELRGLILGSGASIDRHMPTN